MSPQIEFHVEILRKFLEAKELNQNLSVDRKEVVAHATLSAFAHHWPSRVDSELIQLLESTTDIKVVERSRWAVQRRIAIAKLAQEFA